MILFSFIEKRLHLKRAVHLIYYMRVFHLRFFFFFFYSLLSILVI